MFSFKNKLILAFISFGILLISVSSFLIFKMQELSYKNNSIEKAERLHHTLNEEIKFHIRDVENILYAFEKSSTFQRYLSHPEANKKNVQDFFVSFVSSSNKIYQFRYIDENGMEKIKAERADYGAAVAFVLDHKLQNKKNRDYFQQAIHSDKEIIYSKINLNIENGKVETPIKPVLRISKNINYKGQPAGILIINILMAQFIDHLLSSPVYDIFLVDKNGFFIAHPEKEKRWNFYLGADYKIDNIFAEKTACILNNIECRADQFYSKKIQSLSNPDGLILIIQPKMYKIHHQMQKHFKTMLLISLAVLTLSFPIAYLFSITPTRLKKEVDQLNAGLKKKIRAKVNELNDHNIRLEQKVIERTKELEKSTAKLYKQATIDVLTEIPNRRYYFEMSDRYLQLSHRKRQPLSFIIFDIDHFKRVNDTYGHETGDQVLIAICEQINLLLRRSDIFGRIGGEEFAITLLDTDLEKATVIAEKLRESIFNNPYTSRDLSINLSISLGVTQAQENELEVSQMLSRADQALYQAKNEGRNRVIKI